MNWGDTEVKSIVYTLCNMDTHECTDPVTLNFDTPLAVNEVRKINIPIPVGTSLGKVDLMLHVKEVMVITTNILRQLLISLVAR